MYNIFNNLATFSVSVFIFIMMIRMYLWVFLFGSILAGTLQTSRMWVHKFSSLGSYQRWLWLSLLHRLSGTLNNFYVVSIEFIQTFFCHLFILKLFPFVVVVWAFSALCFWAHCFSPQQLLFCWWSFPIIFHLLSFQFGYLLIFL